jgi:hypothetical protein
MENFIGWMLVVCQFLYGLGTVGLFFASWRDWSIRIAFFVGVIAVGWSIHLAVWWPLVVGFGVEWILVWADGKQPTRNHY